MADRTPIEWTDATWNVINGCSVVSPGCSNCYAMRLAGTRFRTRPSRKGLTTESKAGPVWNGQVRFNEKVFTDPLRWTRARRIFVCAHGDLFHENVPDEWIDRVFAVMALAPRHVFQILTKRPERMRAYLTERWQPAPAHRIEYPGLPPLDVAAEIEGASRVDQVREAAQHIAEERGLLDPDRDHLWTPEGSSKVMRFAWPLPNVWLGVSAEDQTRADERIPILLNTPAAVRWLSAEPLLGPIDLTAIKRFAPSLCGDKEHIDALRGTFWTDQSGLPNPDPRWAKPGVPFNDDYDTFGGLGWVVAGGESGPGARPMHPDWARQLRDQCAAAGVPFLFKQWGEWTPGENAQSTIGRTVETADWFNDRWHFESLTPGSAEGMHIDDEPTLYRAGKKAAGRRLDGQIHDGFPTTGAGA